MWAMGRKEKRTEPAPLNMRESSVGFYDNRNQKPIGFPAIPNSSFLILNQTELPLSEQLC